MRYTTIPQTEFVATFLGAANVIGGRAQGGAISIDSDRTLPVVGSLRQYVEGQDVKVVFRPEDVVLGAPSGLVETPYHIGRGEVLETSFAGASESLMVRLLMKGQSGMLQRLAAGALSDRRSPAKRDARRNRPLRFCAQMGCASTPMKAGDLFRWA
jgi:ABC-type Fe3+/spermidine/putrescine transport system ATPase subunit